MIKIQMKSNEQTGPKVITCRGVQVFTEGGSELHGIQSIDIRARVDSVVTAKIELMVEEVEIDMAVASYYMVDPGSGEHKELIQLEFADGTTWNTKEKDKNLIPNPPMRKVNIFEEKLGSLLAVVHRDGGQHTIRHGIEKAVDDAVTKIVKWIHQDKTIINQTDFCKCGQVKHVGFNKCIDCLETED